MMENPFEKFGRTDASEAELREAAKLLGAVVEPPSFWSAIANDASMSVLQRRLALVQLVRRHVLPGKTTIGVFAEMLDGAPWLSDGDITVINEIGGKIPVKWLPDHTVMAIALPGGRGAIYLAIAGLFGEEEIAVALRGMSRDERILSAVIRDAGIEAEG
jgi:hypothetical protein